MNIKGELILKDMYLGTKSEGKVAFLLTEDKKEYRLYRADVYAINDSFFYPFAEKVVIVEGEIRYENYFLVSSLSEIQADNEI